MKTISNLFDFLVNNVFEPALEWVIAHPIIAVVVVVGLLYWAVRGYRMI